MLPLSKSYSVEFKTYTFGISRCSGLLLFLCLCSLPILCRIKSIGASSVIKTSKSISSDCSITCVPMTILNFGLSPFFPIVLKSSSSFLYLSVVINDEWRRKTFSSPKTFEHIRVYSCAFLTVFTITPITPSFVMLFINSAMSSLSDFEIL